MADEGQHPHISATQLSMIERCGEQFRRRYIEGDKVPPGVNLIRGKSCHKARQLNLSQKIETHTDLALAEVVARARDEVHAAFTDEVQLDEGVSIKQARDETVDGAVSLSGCDYASFQTEMQPTAVEEKIVVTIPGLGRDIMGYLDCADIEELVRDAKFVAKTPNKNAADVSSQLTTYSLLYATKVGHLPAGVQIDAVVALKRGPKAVPFLSTRDEADHDVLLARYYAAIKCIDAGIFRPAPADHWVCSPMYCGYYATCPYVRRGERRPTT